MNIECSRSTTGRAPTPESPARQTPMETLETLLSYGPIYGYLGIILVLVLTGAGLPIPEEIPIVAAGVFSAEGSLSFGWAYLSCLVGALLGDTLIYAIGRYLGHGFFKRHPWFAHLLHEEREEQMETLIKKHGLKIFFAARFMVGVRAPIYLAAGVLRVPWRRFLIVDAISATVVVSTVFWLSFYFGEEISGFLRNSQYAITGAVVVGVAIFLFLYFRRRPPATPANNQNSEEAAHEPTEAAETDSSTSSRIVA